MGQAVILSVLDSPPAPLDAAAHFHTHIVPQIRAFVASGEDVIICLADADHTHSAWRLAVVQELAREAAPLRVNAIAGDAEGALGQISGYLDDAPGVTGQILQAADNRAQVA